MSSPRTIDPAYLRHYTRLKIKQTPTDTSTPDTPQTSPLQTPAKRKRESSHFCEVRSKRHKRGKNGHGEIYRFFEFLPNELCLKILCFFTAEQLCKGPCQVSHRFLTLAGDISLWRNLFFREIPNSVVLHSQKRKISDWKSYFIRTHKKVFCPLLHLKNHHEASSDRLVTTLTRNYPPATRKYNSDQLRNLPFMDVFMKKLKWDTFVTVVVCPVTFDDTDTVNGGPPSMPLQVRQLRNALEAAWRCQKNSGGRRCPKEGGWTVSDNCDRRNSSWYRTFPKKATEFLVSAHVANLDERTSAAMVAPVAAVPFYARRRRFVVNYTVEDFWKDFHWLRSEFSGMKEQGGRREGAVFVRPKEKKPK